MSFGSPGIAQSLYLCRFVPFRFSRGQLRRIPRHRFQNTRQRPLTNRAFLMMGFGANSRRDPLSSRRYHWLFHPACGCCHLQFIPGKGNEMRRSIFVHELIKGRNGFALAYRFASEKDSPRPCLECPSLPKETLHISGLSLSCNKAIGVPVIQTAGEVV